MPGATLILEFFGKEFGKKALWLAVNEYFPSAESFEKSVMSNLDQLNRRIGSLAQDAAYLRIQTVKDSYLKHLRYLSDELVPYLRLEAANQARNQVELATHTAEVRKGRIELGATFEQGVQVFRERLQTCDFPLRSLFELLQNVSALKLVYLSWENFLYNAAPGASANSFQLIQSDYRTFKERAVSFFKDSIEPICKARLDFMSFQREVKLLLDKSPEYVSYEYLDRFSSNYADDPFRGDTIEKKEEVTLRFFDFSVWGDWKKHSLATAYDDLLKYEKEYKEHRKEVERLSELHVRVPAVQFLAKMDGLPANLPAVPLETRKVPATV